MTSLSTPRGSGKNGFAVLVAPFLHDPGLPFASVLDSAAIERVFREEEALFGQDDIFSTQIVLWAFRAQTLRDGQGVACASAGAGFDRCYCSFLMPALLSLRGIRVRARLHPRRRSDFRRGRRRGPGDHLSTWTRPQKPAGMMQEPYDQIPATLTLRAAPFDVKVPGGRVETLTVITTVTDPTVYSAELGKT